MLKSLILSKFAGPMIRHGATVLGGYLVASGVADAATAEAVAGGLIAVGGIGLSLIEKQIRF